MATVHFADAALKLYSGLIMLGIVSGVTYQLLCRETKDILRVIELTMPPTTLPAADNPVTTAVASRLKSMDTVGVDTFVSLVLEENRRVEQGTGRAVS